MMVGERSLQLGRPPETEPRAYSCGWLNARVSDLNSKLPGVQMEERDFFEEVTEQKRHTMVCPHCGQPGEYELSWLVRRKRAQVPRGADELDRAKFAKARSYMVRRDDLVGCKNIRCRKRFEVVGIQSVADLQEAAVGTAENRAERIRAAFGRRTLG
jgi:hypothetical protein